MSKQIKLPIINCLHPKKIINPYTREPMLVRCGRCEACNISRYASQSLRCKLESLSHEYCYFVTLTYSNEFIPLAKSVLLPTGRYALVSVCDRLRNTGEVMNRFESDDLTIKSLRKKVQCGDLFPYLSKYDAQLFIKRLRKHFKNEKIRYYLAGEYGPVHYRPHFHLLLWIDNRSSIKSLAKAVHKSWKFGRIDFQRSQGQSSSYVAGYVNGSCRLPRVYSEGKCKPFCSHSFFLGEKFCSLSRKEAYSISAREFVERSVKLDGSDKEYRMWRSYLCYYFPKCPAYHLFSSDVRIKSYRAYLVAKELTGLYSPYRIAKKIADDLTADLPFGEDYKTLNVIPKYQDLIDLICYTYRINKYVTIPYDRLLRSIYMMIRTSKHFLDFCCDHDYSFEKSREMITKIEQFYRDCDYNNLIDQYEIQQDLSEDLLSPAELLCSYNNTNYESELFKNTKLYKIMKANALTNFDNSIKHKVLNDKNRIFENK